MVADLGDPEAVQGVFPLMFALFFLSFLPQFIDPDRGSVALQSVVLGGTQAVIAEVYTLHLALIALCSRTFSRFETVRKCGVRIHRIAHQMFAKA